MANTREQFYTEQEQQQALQDLIERTTGNWQRIQDNTKTIHSYTFYNHPTVKQIKLNNLTSFPAINYAFQNCSNLELLEISNKVNFAGQYYLSDNIFYNCPKLSHLILKNKTQMSTINNDTYKNSVFKGSPIHYRDGIIYVPNTLLNDYKNNDDWKLYIIKPITYDSNGDIILSSKFDTINQPWSEIINDCNRAVRNNDPSEIDKYQIGDSKIFYDKDGVQYYAELVGKFKDEDINGNKVATTWLTRGLYPSASQFSSQTSNNTGYDWDESLIRTDLNNKNAGFFAKMVAEIFYSQQSNVPTYDTCLTNEGTGIKEVKKIFRRKDGQEGYSFDKLWIPTIRELSDEASYEQNGPRYSEFFNIQDKRIKYITLFTAINNFQAGVPYFYWTRSRANNSTVYCISDSGGYSSISYNTSQYNSKPIGICFGFCI